MGAIGGTILGKSGVGSLDGGDIWGGTGFEGSPDGNGVAAPALPLIYDFTSGIPAGMSAHNGQTFVASGSFTDDEAYVDPGNGDKQGIWEDADSGLLPDDFDMELSFAWFVAAATNSQRVGPGVFDVAASIDELSPYQAGSCTDRSFSRMLPARFAIEEGGSTATPMPGSTSTHTLAGGELTADGATIHTIGWSKLGANFRSFFDGVLSGTPFDLAAGDRTNIEDCTRIGIAYYATTVVVPINRFQTLTLAAQGTIYPN
jgi:hypothetical protein